MSRIAKKSRPVKGAKRSKGLQTESKKAKKKPLPPRYTIRKDSLDRRYAIDKRTGKRVSVSKADKERARRKRAAIVVERVSKPQVIFHRIKPLRPPKVKTSKKKRSEASKKGWETRRAKIPLPPPSSTPVIFEGRPPSFAELIGPLIPEGMRMHVLAGVADRAAKYPKVEKAADRAWINLQVEAFAHQRAIGAGQEPEPLNTPRFDRIYGEGHGAHVRFNYYARAMNLEDIDQMVDTLEQDEDNDYGARELYTLYFSPEVA
jgi:hypothetical protein